MNTTSLIQKILIVENDTQEQERIGLLLDALGIDFQAATTAPEALRVLREESFDLVLSRPGMADDHALPVLAQIAHVVPMTPIVALKRAGESTELWGGVTPWEILDCPVLPEQLQSALMRASGALSTQQRIAMLEDQLAQAMTPPPIVGSSKEMIQLLEKMEDAAFSHQPTILIGETGGKIRLVFFVHVGQIVELVHEPSVDPVFPGPDRPALHRPAAARSDGIFVAG